MKRLASVLGIALLVGAMAVPVFAWGPRWGMGHHMMGHWGGGPGYSWNDGPRYDNLTEEQRTRLEKLYQEFNDETARLRNELRAKTGDLNTLLSLSNPDTEKARALQKEISGLRTKLAEKRLNFRLEARKINPEARFGWGYGRGGYGPSMRGYAPATGYGQHMEGYGPGYCWN